MEKSPWSKITEETPEINTVVLVCWKENEDNLHWEKAVMREDQIHKIDATEVYWIYLPEEYEIQSNKNLGEK